MNRSDETATPFGHGKLMTGVAVGAFLLAIVGAAEIVSWSAGAPRRSPELSEATQSAMARHRVRTAALAARADAGGHDTSPVEAGVVSR